MDQEAGALIQAPKVSPLGPKLLRGRFIVLEPLQPAHEPELRRAAGTEKGIKRAKAAFKRAKIATDYYNAEIHAAAFALPQWVARLVP